MDQTDQTDQTDQSSHTHGFGRRRRYFHHRMSKWKRAEHWLQKHFWRRYWAYILAIVLGLLVAKFCVPVDF